MSSSFETRAYSIGLLVNLMAVALFGANVFAQDARWQILEEIQSFPEDKTGEWTIGGEKFIANELTDFNFDNPPKKGVLCELAFVFRDEEKFAISIEPTTDVANEVVDGPHVFWTNETTAEVIYLAEGKINRQTHEGITEPKELSDFPGFESTILLDPTLPETPKCVWEEPSRLMAISDLEGNYTTALRFLQNNKVLDEDGHWAWGDGHLVLVGDLVDRGSMVSELMLMFRRLEREAQSAGGQVHYVLGNHEVMVMAGDLRYIHPKYHFTSGRYRMEYNQFYSPKSDIGRWWRSKNAAIRIGDLLFVHAGYSPLLDQAQLDLETLNQRVRDGIPPALPASRELSENPTAHSLGPLWYRGYFDRYAAEFGGKATEAEVKKILDRHSASHIIVGHTVVEQVGPLDESGQVIGIDVKWARSKYAQGLLKEDGKLYRVTITAEREQILLPVSK